MFEENIESFLAGIFGSFFLCTIVAFAFLAICAAIVIYIFYDKKIEQNSTALADIRKVNAQYSKIFNMDFKGTLTYQRSLGSKRAFDNANMDTILIETLKGHEDFIKKCVSDAQRNYSNYGQYISQVKYAYRSRTTHWCTNGLMRWMEKRKFDKAVLKPATSLSVKIEISYISPKGRNSYYNHKTYNTEDIARALTRVKDIRTEQVDREYERSLMTPQLRYKILRRDGFKCQICGATSETAKLHVDHIKPISKGGRTVESNLRTLCDLCNLGKSASYDPNGIN